jgi:hypothetical protein
MWPLEERKTAWERCRISVTYYQQKAELPDLKATCLEYAEINAQVLQDVILRVERAFQAFFRRLKAGEKPGYPRFQGRNRYNSFTYPQYGGGAVLDGGVLGLSKIGRIPIRLHRPLEGTPKTVTISQEADGWYACVSCAEAPAQPLPPTGQETGIDVGLKVFLITCAKLGATWRSASSASPAARMAATAARRPWRCWRRHIRRCGANAPTSTIRRRSRCSVPMSRSLWKICRLPTWCGTITWQRASAMPAGHSSAPSSKPRQCGPGVECSR